MTSGAKRDILGLLEQGGGFFVSGSAISAQLGITRAAVWKKINVLRDKGFDIEAFSGRGYRLKETPDFSVEELKTLIHGSIGKEIIFLKETPSTNDIAMGGATPGVKGSAVLPHGAVIIADSQTKGKGRLGRKWLSPPGSNIYMSVILRPEIPPKDGTLLTLLSAVSCAESLREVTGIPVEIKWPNDLMAGGKKLGGILLEMRTEPDRITHAVIGIGINVNMPVKKLPSDVAGIATSILNETGKKHKRTVIIAEILNRLDKELNELKAHGRTQLLNKWRRLSSTLGKEVLVETGKETLKGIAKDIDEDGRLILKTPTGIKVIHSGDLRMLR